MKTKVFIFLFFSLFVFACSKKYVIELRTAKETISESEAQSYFDSVGPDNNKIYLNKTIILNEHDMQSARAYQEPGEITNVHISLTPEARTKFYNYTNANIGSLVAIIINNKTYNIIPVRVPVPSGDILISRFKSVSEAQNIANYINKLRNK